MGVTHHVPSSTSTKAASSSSKSRPTRWLLCYPGAAGRGDNSSDGSHSSESENESAVSTPSPTDHGFKIPNSYSNKRPNSLPVALQNSIRTSAAATNGDANIDLLSLDPDERVTPSSTSAAAAAHYDQQNHNEQQMLMLGGGVGDDDVDPEEEEVDGACDPLGVGLIPPPPMFSSDPQPQGMLSGTGVDLSPPPQQELMVEEHYGHSGE